MNIKRKVLTAGKKDLRSLRLLSLLLLSLSQFRNTLFRECRARIELRGKRTIGNDMLRENTGANNGELQSVLINLDTGRYGIEGVQTRNIPEVNIRVTDPVT
jgi:hypothetical protein